MAARRGRPEVLGQSLGREVAFEDIPREPSFSTRSCHSSASTSSRSAESTTTSSRATRRASARNLWRSSFSDAGRSGPVKIRSKAPSSKGRSRASPTTRLASGIRSCAIAIMLSLASRPDTSPLQVLRQPPRAAGDVERSRRREIRVSLLERGRAPRASRGGGGLRRARSRRPGSRTHLVPANDFHVKRVLE